MIISVRSIVNLCLLFSKTINRRNCIDYCLFHCVSLRHDCNLLILEWWMEWCCLPVGFRIYWMYLYFLWVDKHLTFFKISLSELYQSIFMFDTQKSFKEYGLQVSGDSGAFCMDHCYIIRIYLAGMQLWFFIDLNNGMKNIPGS